MTDDRARFDVTAQLPALRRYALALTRNAADAEDLVNEALVRAYESRASFRSDKNLRVWLLSVLHNCFIDGKRRQRAEQVKLLRASELAETFAPPAQEHALRLAQIRQAFMGLPGFIFHVFARSKLDDLNNQAENFVVYDVSAQAAAALREHEGFEFYNERNQQMWSLAHTIQARKR